MAKKKKVEESPISTENKVDTPKGTAKMTPREEAPKGTSDENKGGIFQNIFGAKK
jgi:hypothetical protein